MIFLSFILVDYQTGLWEKYLVTGDWNQSKHFLQDCMCALRRLRSHWQITLKEMNSLPLGGGGRGGGAGAGGTIGASLICFHKVRLRTFFSGRFNMSRDTAFPTRLHVLTVKTHDQPALLCSVFRVFPGHCLGSQGSKASSGGQRRLWSACADAQADLSLRSSHTQSWRKCCLPASLLVNILLTWYK